jgi:hypothetical protein
MYTPQIITLIGEDECIGDSLDTINENFAKLDSLIVALSGVLVTSVISTKTVYTGNGVTSIFAVEGGLSLNANDYRVDINGVVQEPDTDYIISINQITFTTPPPNGSKIVIVTNASVSFQTP